MLLIWLKIPNQTIQLEHKKAQLP